MKSNSNRDKISHSNDLFKLIWCAEIRAILEAFSAELLCFIKLGTAIEPSRKLVHAVHGGLCIAAKGDSKLRQSQLQKLQDRVCVSNGVLQVVCLSSSKHLIPELFRLVLKEFEKIRKRTTEANMLMSSDRHSLASFLTWITHTSRLRCTGRPL